MADELTPQQKARLKLQGNLELYNSVRRKDIVGGAGATFALVSDIIAGRKSASDMISQHGGSMTEAERSKAKNDLLKTLSDYQKSRRADLTSRDKDRLDFLKEQYGNITGERKWAMEQVVELEKQQMQGQSTVTAAKLAALTSDMQASDRALETGDFRAATNEAERRAMIDAGSLVKLDKYIGVLDNAREGGTPLDQRTIIAQFEAEVGSLPAGQAEHAFEMLNERVPEFGNAMAATIGRNPNPDLANQFGNFRNVATRAVQEATQHRQQRADWQDRRDETWQSFERRSGPGANPQLITELKNIFNETPEDTTARVNEMLATMPDEIRDPAKERVLEEDDFTRNIRAQLDRLDDPRFMFAGSRHERLRAEIMDSPEFQQFMAEKGDGGMISPDQAFTMMLDETKKGLLAAPANTASVMNANAMALRGDVESGPGGAVGQQPASFRQPQPFMLDPQRPLTDVPTGTAEGMMESFGETDLAQRYDSGRKRQLATKLGRSAGMTPADGLRDSALTASRAAQRTSRLTSLLKDDES
tara:strand:- start:668 stop:2263 length:1596 start_codon:yes stop_codon:yes gene_type:complete